MEKILEGEMDVAEITDDDHREKIEMALKAWDELCTDYQNADFSTEMTYQMNADIGGTCDVIAWNSHSYYIIDWKFGQGITVAAAGNAQLMFYAMVAEFNVPDMKGKNLTVAVIQPIPSRDSHETLDTWEVPDSVFDLFKQSFAAALKATGLHAGAHCQFCPAAATCPEKSGEARSALMYDPLLVEKLAESLDLALLLEPWIREVKKVAHDQLELGTSIEGFKLVAKKAMRHWHDDSEDKNGMRNMLIKHGKRKIKVVDIITETLCSPAQAEKVFKKAGVDFDPVNAYIEKTSSGTTLAREDDKREGILSADALRAALDRLG